MCVCVCVSVCVCVCESMRHLETHTHTHTYMHTHAHTYIDERAFVRTNQNDRPASKEWSGQPRHRTRAQQQAAPSWAPRAQNTAASEGGPHAPCHSPPVEKKKSQCDKKKTLHQKLNCTPRIMSSNFSTQNPRAEPE